MWPNPQEIVDLITFTEEILNGKLHFLCSVGSGFWSQNYDGSRVFLSKKSNQVFFHDQVDRLQ